MMSSAASTSAGATRAFSPVVFQKHRTKHKGLASQSGLGFSSASASASTSTSTSTSSGIDTAARARIRASATTTTATTTALGAVEKEKSTISDEDYKKNARISSSGSESKLRQKRRKQRSKVHAYGYGHGYGYTSIFKILFVACLVLFVHALSGIGGAKDDVPVSAEQGGGGRQHGHGHGQVDIEARSSHGHGHGHPRFRGFSGSRPIAKEDHVRLLHQKLQEHDHLAIDPDGHYTYSAAFADNRPGEEGVYRWRWAAKNLNDTRVELAVGNVETVTEEEALNLPTPTETYIERDDDDAPTASKTPVGASPTADDPNAHEGMHISTSASSHEPKINHEPPKAEDDDTKKGEEGDRKRGDDAWGGRVRDREEMLEHPLFDELDGPVYPIRIHLPPSSIGVPEEHRRGRWRRRHGGGAV